MGVVRSLALEQQMSVLPFALGMLRGSNIGGGSLRLGEKISFGVWWGSLA